MDLTFILRAPPPTPPVAQWLKFWPHGGRPDVRRTHGLRDKHFGGDYLQVPIFEGKLNKKYSEQGCGAMVGFNRLRLRLRLRGRALNRLRLRLRLRPATMAPPPAPAGGGGYAREDIH
jgi:hypothetical protein